jgi:uncharacterized protein (TIGR02300 family)
MRFPLTEPGKSGKSENRNGILEFKEKLSVATTAQTAGLKRICTGCGLRFYDLNKRPIVCPGCSVEFTGDIKVKGRRGRAAIKEEEQIKAVPIADVEDEVIVADDELDVVSLEDVVEDGGDEDEDGAIVLDEDSIEDIEVFEDDALDGDDKDIVPVEDED